MLKYGNMKVAKKADSPLMVAFAWLQLLLVLVGLVGISIELFKDQGWLKQMLSSLMNTSMSTLVIILPVGFFVFIVGKSWLDSHGEKESSSLIADAMLYVMMMVGGWFVFQWIT